MKTFKISCEIFAENFLEWYISIAEGDLQKHSFVNGAFRMTIKIHRMVIATMFFFSTLLLSMAESPAGVISGFPTVTGPGSPVSLVISGDFLANNDDYSGTGLSNPNLISFGGITISGLDPIDLSLPVQVTGGTTEYFLDTGEAFNQTGVAWTGFVVELGSGTGGGFQRLSTAPISGVDGLDFDFPIPNPILTSSDFPTINHLADVITFSGGNILAGASATGQGFAFDIPDITSAAFGYTFTIRLQPVAAPDSLLGDFNNDDIVDLADLDQYIGNIGATATGALEALDLNDNGTVDAADLQQHYTDLVGTSNGNTGTFAGDANLDGVVDVLGDAAALINNLGVAATSWSQGDFNGDGAVDVLSDAAALINNLGSTNVGAGASSTTAVPEPGCLALLALTGAGAAIRRRR